MKATVRQLWNTGREIISFDNSEIERPATISELKKCENVIVGGKLFNGGPTEVIIDDKIYLVESVKLQHPSGCGSIYALEIL